MKSTTEKIISKIPTISWWLSDKFEGHRRKKRAKYGVDAIDNIGRLYKLKELGAISDKDFQELKEKLKQQI